MIGSIVGCCMTFKFGTVSSNIDRLKTQTSLLREYEHIKRQNEKADILKLFYDKQGLDGEDGLSREEFDYLVFSLDDDMKNEFPNFEDFDENGDGVIDIFEFDNMLDEIYKDLYDQKKKNAEKKIGDHYMNRDQEINNNRTRKRRESIQIEKAQKKVKKPLSIFRRLK